MSATAFKNPLASRVLARLDAGEVVQIAAEIFPGMLRELYGLDPRLKLAAERLDDLVYLTLARPRVGREPIRVVNLDCWHANEIIYQAEGRTDDGRFVYVRYRRPWFSVGVADTADDAPAADTFVSDACPDHDPSTINVETLRAWCGDRFVWPDEITGYANRPG